MREYIGAQGEVNIFRVDNIPDTETSPAEKNRNGHAIVGHSESGHHHVLTTGDVIERLTNVPAGMKIFYAMLDEPGELIQDAPNPHEGHTLPPGLYEFRISREYDPFLQQARRVAD